MAVTALNSPPVATVAEAIERMEAIHAFLPKRNGVANFNEIYLEVTRAVHARIGTGFFQDDDFLGDLDVAFANRYFDALRTWTDGRRAPKSWKVLFVNQNDRGVHPAQFALTGMNAHINFDLALAVIATCKARNEDVDRGHRRGDFDKVNEIFVELEPELRRRFQPRFFDPVDRDFPEIGRVQDVLALFSIEKARDHAWDQARLMDDLRGTSARLAADLLDRMVSAFGHGLIVHV
jgi:hypothetical protein